MAGEYGKVSIIKRPPAGGLFIYNELLDVLRNFISLPVLLCLGIAVQALFSQDSFSIHPTRSRWLSLIVDHAPRLLLQAIALLPHRVAYQHFLFQNLFR